MCLILFNLTLVKVGKLFKNKRTVRMALIKVDVCTHDSADRKKVVAADGKNANTYGKHIQQNYRKKVNEHRFADSWLDRKTCYFFLVSFGLILTTVLQKATFQCNSQMGNLTQLTLLTMNYWASSFESLNSTILLLQLKACNRFIGNPPQSKLHCRALFEDTPAFGIFLLADTASAAKPHWNHVYCFIFFSFSLYFIYFCASFTLMLSNGRVLFEQFSIDCAVDIA